MAVITTGNSPKALWPGMNAWWGRAYNEHKVEYTDLFDTDRSKKNFEEDGEITGFGLAPVKAQGSSVSFDSETQGTISRYNHVAYGLGFIVTREELDDNLYDVVGKRRAAALAFSFRQTKENVGANVYNRAFNSSYVGGDGVELLSLVHPTKNGTQSNHITTAADLSEASLEDLTIQMMQAQNSRGMKINLMPRCLIVPVNEWYNANRILKSVLQNDTANNSINALKATNAIPEGIKLNHYLTDVNAWFLRSNVSNGMKCFDRVAQTFSDDNDFDTDNLKYKGYARYSMGWSDFRAVFGSPGA